MENLRENNLEKIRSFMNKWFEHFDQLDENSFFTQYLSEDVKMKFPGNDLFTGHAAFSNWFTESKNNMLSNTKHHISDVKITEEGKDRFAINFKVRYVAEMKDQKIDMDVTEDWKLFWDNTKDQPLISEYIVS